MKRRGKMRHTGAFAFAFLIGLQFSQVKSASVDAAVTASEDTVFSFTAKQLLQEPPAQIANWKVLAIEGIKDSDDRNEILRKVQQLPKLVELRLYSCDLSKFSESDPVPLKSGFITISGGKLSQSALRWLSKFPSAVTITIGTSLQGLNLSACKFTRIILDNCEIPRSAVVPLIENSFMVTFKEVTLVDEKK